MFANEEAGLPWKALCAAYDAIAAGSHAGLDRLRALVAAHPESPSLTWLDEVTSWAAGDDERVARCRERQKDLLMSGDFGECATSLVPIVRFARKQLGAEMTAIRDAWQRLSAYASQRVLKHHEEESARRAEWQLPRLRLARAPLPPRPRLTRVALAERAASSAA